MIKLIWAEEGMEEVEMSAEEIEASQAEAVAAEAQARKAALDAYMQEFRGMRTDLLNVLSGIALAEDLLPEFKTLRRGLLDIPELPAVANAKTADEAKAACKAAYSKLVKAAPPAFIVAFKELQG